MVEGANALYVTRVVSLKTPCGRQQIRSVHGHPHTRPSCGLLGEIQVGVAIVWLFKRILNVENMVAELKLEGVRCLLIDKTKILSCWPLPSCLHSLSPTLTLQGECFHR